MSRSVLDVGQRDVGDGGVEHDHQLRDRDEHEGPAEMDVLPGRARCSVVVAVSDMGFLRVGVRVEQCRWTSCRSDGRVHGGRQDDLVDDPGDASSVGVLAEDEEAVQDDAGEGRREQVDVDVGADLAALPGPLEDRAGDAAILGPRTSRRKASANSASRLIAVSTLANVATALLVGEAAEAAGRRDEVAAQAAGVGHARAVCLDREQGVDDQARPCRSSGGRAWPCDAFARVATASMVSRS